MEVIVLFGILFVCMSLSIPLGISVGISTLISFFIFTDTPLTIIAQACITGLDSFPMLAIPFFIMAGVIMSKGGIAERLVDTFGALVGHKKGGLGIVTVITCGFFGAISGSASATVSAVGGFMMPEMKKRNYSAGYAASVTACAASTSLLIPPSLCLVIYGVTTNTSIGDLFIAGIFPGILMVAALCVGALYYAIKHGYSSNEKQSFKVFLQTAWEAKWGLLAPIIILGGIYGGFFTPTEAAVVSVVYATFIGLFVYKELTWKALYDALLESMLINGMVMYLLGLATAFAKFLTLAQIPAKLVDFILGVTDNPIFLLLICNIILLLIGMVVDNIPVIIIMSPLMLPIALSAGMSPITFGVVMVLNTTIGLITPPYGANLFIAMSIAKVKLGEIMKYYWVFLLCLLISLMLTTYVPILTTWFLG